MTIVDEQSTPGGHPTPEQRQDRRPRRRFVKLSRDALDALADRLSLPLAATRLLEALTQELVHEWRYEPRIVPARSRRELWELLYNARTALPVLIEAGLVAEHRGVGFEVLCWPEIVADAPGDYDKRRQRAANDLAQGDRRAETIEALYAVSLDYELPCSGVHGCRESVQTCRESVQTCRGRPAETRPIELLELLEPPQTPPLAPEVADLDAEGGDSDSETDQDEPNRSRTAPLAVPILDDRREQRIRRAVLTELARLEAEHETQAGNVIRSPAGYLRAIERRLADDDALGDQIDAYRRQYPAAEPPELAARIDADRAGASPTPPRSVDHIVDPVAREARAMQNPAYAAALEADALEALR